MRYRTRFPGDEEQKTVYMNLRFPAEAVFPDADEVWDIGLVPDAGEPNIADLKGRVEFMDPLEQLILREEDPERFYRYSADGLEASSEVSKIKEAVYRPADEASFDPEAPDCYQPRYCGGTIESTAPVRQLPKKFLGGWDMSRHDYHIALRGESHRPKRRKYRVRGISLAQNIG